MKKGVRILVCVLLLSSLVLASGVNKSALDAQADARRKEDPPVVALHFGHTGVTEYYSESDNPMKMHKGKRADFIEVINSGEAELHFTGPNWGNVANSNCLVEVMKHFLEMLDLPASHATWRIEVIEENLGSGTLARAGSSSGLVPDPGPFRPNYAQIALLSNTDPSPGQFHSTVRWNFDTATHFVPTPCAIDAPLPGAGTDFWSTAMHELLHAVGHASVVKHSTPQCAEVNPNGPISTRTYFGCQSGQCSTANCQTQPGRNRASGYERSMIDTRNAVPWFVLPQKDDSYSGPDDSADGTPGRMAVHNTDMQFAAGAPLVIDGASQSHSDATCNDHDLPCVMRAVSGGVARWIRPREAALIRELGFSLAWKADECPFAKKILLGATSYSFSAEAATLSGGTLSCGGAAVADVWFTFQADAGGTYTIDSCGASAATAVHTYQSCHQTTTSVSCSASGCANGGSITVAMAQGDALSIRLSSTSGTATGSITVTATAAGSPGDTSGNAFIARPGSNAFTLFNTFTSISGTCVTSIGATTEPALHYSFTPVDAGAHQFSVTGGSWISLLINGLEPAGGCNDAGATVEAHIDATDTVFIRIGHDMSPALTSLAASLTVTPPALREECSTAKYIGSFSGAVTLTDEFTTGSTSSSITPKTCGHEKDVWIAFSLSNAVGFQLSALPTDANGDFQVEVYSGTQCLSLSSVANKCSGQGTLTLSTQPAGEYYVRVGRSVAGTGTLNISPNIDECSLAIAAFHGRTDISLAATTTSSDPTICNPGHTRDAWLTFTAPKAGNYFFSTCETSSNNPTRNMLSAYSGNCASLGSEFCGPACANNALQSLALKAMSQGETVIVRVGSEPTAQAPSETVSVDIGVQICGPTTDFADCGGNCGSYGLWRNSFAFVSFQRFTPCLSDYASGGLEITDVKFHWHRSPFGGDDSTPMNFDIDIWIYNDLTYQGDPSNLDNMQLLHHEVTTVNSVVASSAVIATSVTLSSPVGVVKGDIWVGLSSSNNIGSPLSFNAGPEFRTDVARYRGWTAQLSPTTPANDVIATNSFPLALDSNSLDFSISFTHVPAANFDLTVNSVTGVSCTGGSDGAITTAVTGGLNPITYLWNTGATTSGLSGIPAGSYSVTATDANSEVDSVANIAVGQPSSALSVSASASPVTCAGAPDGSVTLTPSGGTSGYSFAWADSGSTSGSRTGLDAAVYSFTVTDANGCTDSGTATVTGPSTALSASSTVTALSCNGDGSGAIAVTTSGGTPAYTFSWTGPSAFTSAQEDISSLIAGAYSLTVTDANGCTTTVAETVTQPPVLSSSTTGTDVSCGGGSNGAVDLTPSGGTPGYTYSWATGQTTQDLSALVASTYVVTITDVNGCTTTDSQVVSEPATLSVTESLTHIDCNGALTGAIAITVNGGSPAHTFSWAGPSAFTSTSEDITTLTAGTYALTVTDANGCTATGNYVLNEPPAFSAAVGDVNLNCPSDTASLTATPSGGSPGYTFNWSNGGTTGTITGLGPATYSVTVTDANSCTAVTSGTVDRPTSFSLTGTVTAVACKNANSGSIDLSVTGATPAYSYAWSNGQTTQDIGSLFDGTYTVTITDANGCTVSDSYSVTEPAQALSGSTSVTNVLCRGASTGAVDLSPTGGTAGYTYNWNTGASTQDLSDVAAAAYTVTVTDANGCTFSTSDTVTQPASVVSGSVATTHVECNGGNTGALVLTPSGGDGGPYTFSWSNLATSKDISGLVAGTFTVTITDSSGCTGTAGDTVTQPSALSVLTSSTEANCANDGTATASGAGGTPGYTYNWSSGGSTATITNLANGNFVVTVTDANACTATDSVTVASQADSLFVTLAATDSSCNGANDGSIDAVVTPGVPPYTYSWNTGATTEDLSGLAPASYSLTVTDAEGCIATAGTSTAEPALLQITSTPSTSVTCNGGSDGSVTVNHSGGTAGYTYIWNTGATSKTISNVPADAYSVTVTDANGCADNVGISVGQPPAVSIAVDGVTNVMCNGASTGSIAVTSSGGTGALSFSWSSGATSEDISSLSAGTYTLTATDQNGCFDTAVRTVTEPTALSASTSSTSASCCTCSDGTATVSPTGGTAAYTFSWQSGSTSATDTNLAAGNHGVTVTDTNGCTFSTSVNVAAPGSPSASISISNVACRGDSTGAIDVTPSGGSAPYTYAWADGPTTQDRTGLIAGSYDFTVTDSLSCTFVGTNNAVTQPVAVVSASHSSSNLQCFESADGSISVTPSGGTAAYTVSWDQGLGNGASQTALAAATYNYLVTDAQGCTFGPTSVTLTEPTAVSFTETVVRPTCLGDSDASIAVSASGGAVPGSYTYAWSPNTADTTASVNNLPAGTYSVTVSDTSGGSCSATNSIVVADPALLTVSASPVNPTCNGFTNGRITASGAGGYAPYSYLWSPGGATTATLDSIGSGTYSVTTTDDRGCTASSSAELTDPPALSSSSTATNNVCFGGSTGAVDLTVTGGKTPYSYLWSNGEVTQDITGLSSATFTVTVTDDSACTATKSQAVGGPSAAMNFDGSVVVDAACAGGSDGSITLTLGNFGAGPHTFSWSNGASAKDISGLTSASYTVTATNGAGCVHVDTFVVAEATTLSVTSTVNDMACEDPPNTGSISLDTINGGTAPYTFQWSHGVTTQNAASLAAGAYSVTVRDANTCSTSLNFNVEQPSAISSTGSTVTDLSCRNANDGAINLVLVGGLEPYNISWSANCAACSGTSVSNLSADTYGVTVTDANGLCSHTRSFVLTNPATLSTSASIDHVSCNGADNGRIVITASGGATPYSFSINNGATQSSSSFGGLAGGTYSYQVVDNRNCAVDIGGQIINEPTAISVGSQSLTHISCNGDSTGQVSTTINGGTNPLGYSWSNGVVGSSSISAVTAGLYTLSVTDANSCNAQFGFTLTQPSALTVSTSKTDLSNCGGSDGTATASGSGGTAPYTYAWSNGGPTGTITGLAAGTYTVTVTDNLGCQSIGSASPAPGSSDLSVSIAHEDVSCNGFADGSVTVNATLGTAPYTYAWDHGPSTSSLNGLSGDSYRVTVSDSAGCSVEASATVVEPPSLTISGFTSTNPLCAGSSDGTASVTAGGGVAPLSYAWSNGALTRSSTGHAAGPAAVTVTDFSGCTVESSTELTDPFPLSIDTFSHQQDVSCFGASDGAIDLSVSGGTGSLSARWSDNFIATPSSRSNLGPATYTVTVTDANACSAISSSEVIVEPPLLQITGLTVSHVTCNGDGDGSVTVQHTGGTGSASVLGDTDFLSGGSYTVTVQDDNSCSDTAGFTVKEPAPISVSLLTTSHNPCFGDSLGSADVSVTGGTTPYVYRWSNGGTNKPLSGASAGSHSLEVTDANGCSDNSFMVTVNEPAELQIDFVDVTDASCFAEDGDLSVFISGGTGGYRTNYRESGGSTGQLVSGALPAGTYSLTVTDDNNCQVTSSPHTINEPALLEVTGSAITHVASCFGEAEGEISLTISGGDGFYSVNWNGGAGSGDTVSTLTAGSYSATVEDGNGCSTTAGPFTVTQPSQLIGSVTQSRVTCAGRNDGALQASAAGSTGTFDFSWSTGASTSEITGLAAGIYGLTISDQTNPSCQWEDSSIVLATVAAPSSVVDRQHVGCKGANDGSIVLTTSGGTSPFTFAWTGSGSTSASATGLSPAVYSVTFTDVNGCFDSLSRTIEEPSLALTFDASQRATTDVSCNGAADGALTVGVINGSGWGGVQYSWSNGAVGASISGLAAGEYSVTATDSNGCAITAGPFTVGTKDAVGFSVDTTTTTCCQCQDGTATVNSFTGGAGGPFTFAWSTGSTSATATGLASGNSYSVTVTDAAGCTAVNSAVSVGGSTQLSLQTSTTPVTCSGGSDGTVTVTAGEGSLPPLSYLWSSGASTSTVTGLSANETLSVTVSDAAGCVGSTSASVADGAVVVVTPTAVGSSCPGCTDGEILATVSGGAEPFRFLWSNAATTTDGNLIRDLAPGTYAVTVTDANGCVGVAQGIVVERDSHPDIETICPICLSLQVVTGHPFSAIFPAERNSLDFNCVEFLRNFQALINHDDSLRDFCVRRLDELMTRNHEPLVLPVIVPEEETDIVRTAWADGSLSSLELIDLRDDDPPSVEDSAAALFLSLSLSLLFVLFHFFLLN